MIAGLRDVAALPDPVGSISEFSVRPNGLRVGRMRIPLGVIGMIYESRPNVTVDAAALCVKAGNAVILRGGSEAIHSNLALAEVSCAAAPETWGPRGRDHHRAHDRPRRDRSPPRRLDEFIDLIIPARRTRPDREGDGDIDHPRHLAHDAGVCHVYPRRERRRRDGDRASCSTRRSVRWRSATDSRRCSCHRDAATTRSCPDVLEGAARRGRRDPRRRRDAPRSSTRPEAVSDEPTGAKSTSTPILAVKVVDDLDEAVAHVRRYRLGPHRHHRHERTTAIPKRSCVESTLPPSA